MRSVVTAILLSLAPAVVFSQQPSPIAIFSGAPSDRFTSPATFNLIPKAPGARTGKIWVRYADDGLHIHGEVDAPVNDIRWPAEKKDMLASDHVEVWLSATTSVDMPPIGYGNQFGENDFKNPDDCVAKDDSGKPEDPNTPDVAACRRWFATQLDYRKQFERLFTRQWLAAGSSDPSRSLAYFEDFANAAWTTLSKQSFADELPEVLKPKADDGVTSQFNIETQPSPGENANAAPVATGYNFNLVIPWGAFPPSNEFNLHYLSLMVDVYAHAPDGKKMGALSTTSSERVWGRPVNFNHVILNVPRRYSISPCQADPKVLDVYGNPHSAWYFPTNGATPLVLDHIFDLENPAGGYMYAPSGVSPEAHEEEHFWKALPDGATVCGPELGYHNGKTTTTSKFSVERGHFDVRQLDDGWVLVRTGPDAGTVSQFGSGACGACTVIDFHMFAVSPAGDTTAAFDFNTALTGDDGQPDDADFNVAPDWSRITTYVGVADNSDGGGQPDIWTATTYCLAGHVYKQCGEQKNATPPSPRNYKPEQ